MQSLGNDFMVIDAINQPIHLQAETIKQLADRRLGIGFDQCLLVEASDANDASDVDFHYRIFNADGSEVGQCGNGARCLAHFVIDKQLTQKRQIKVATSTTHLSLTLNEDDSVTVNMGQARLRPDDIPFLADQQALSYPITVAGESVHIQALSMGNPHAVLTVDDVAVAPVDSLGTVLAKHPSFPQGVNVGFMQIIDRSHIKLRVYERGAGETLACGSGACAAVVAGQLAQHLQHDVIVHLTGGELAINWEGDRSPVLMTGSAVSVYEGYVST